METLCVWVPEPADFPRARKAALKVGRARLGEEAVLWSWWEAHSGRTSIGPDYRCSEDEHAWEVYGRVRGATLKISVNGGQYEFCLGRVRHEWEMDTSGGAFRSLPHGKRAVSRSGH